MPVGRDQHLTSPPVARRPPLGGSQPPPLPPPAAQLRAAAAALQALEKGGQGANAKFTYSCDGHSELVWWEPAGDPYVLIGTLTMCALPQPPAQPSLLTHLPMLIPCPRSLQLPHIKWIQ